MPCEGGAPSRDTAAPWAGRSAPTAGAGGPPRLTADLHRDFGAGVGELREASFEGLSVGVARSVLAHGLVDWRGNSEVSVGGHFDSSVMLVLISQIVTRARISPSWPSRL